MKAQVVKIIKNQSALASIVLLVFLLVFFLFAKSYVSSSIMLLWSLPIFRNIFFTLRFNGSLQSGWGFYLILASSALFLFIFVLIFQN